MPETIGYIGLGAMGLPMARCLAAAGHRVIAHDVDAAALETAAAVDGIEPADSARAAVAAAGTAAAAGAPVAAGTVAPAGVLITCLPHPDAVEAVYAEVDRSGLLACDCSTITPAQAVRLHDQLAARGVRYVECPMLGGVVQAERGELYLLLSGDLADVARLGPILAVIGRGHRHVGGPGTANLFKVVQNGLGHVQMVAIAEALALIARAGADPAVWCEVVAAGHGMADTPLFRAKARDMLADRPAVGGTLRIAAKDAGLASALAKALGVEAPLIDHTDTVYQAALAMGLAEADFADLARAVEQRMGVSLQGRLPSP